MCALGFVGSVALAGCSVDVWANQDNDNYDHRVENVYEVTDEVARLELQGKTGNITVTTGAGPVLVKEILRYSNDNKPHATHSVTGGKLTLTDESCSVKQKCSVEYVLRVPDALAVNAWSNAGSIEVSGLRGEVTLSTEAGSIKAVDLSAKKVTAHSSAGSVDVASVAVPDLVDAKTGAGSVAVRVPRGVSYTVDAQTASGDRTVEVELDSASAHKIRVRSSAGSVEVRNL